VAPMFSPAQLEELWLRLRRHPTPPHSPSQPYGAFGVFCSMLAENVGVFHSSALQLVPISPNASQGILTGTDGSRRRCGMHDGRPCRAAASRRWRPS
jgi:hypothetical protein